MDLKDPSKHGGKPYTSRYIGSLVGDFHRTLLYGGIYGCCTPLARLTCTLNRVSIKKLTMLGPIATLHNWQAVVFCCPDACLLSVAVKQLADALTDRVANALQLPWR